MLATYNFAKNVFLGDSRCLKFAIQLIFYKPYNMFINKIFLAAVLKFTLWPDHEKIVKLDNREN